MDSLTHKVLNSPDDLTDAMDVRRKVFQEEQGIDSTIDFDGNDEDSVHIVIYKDEVPVGTGRMRMLNPNHAKIERVAVLSDMRKQGLGKRILSRMHDYLSKNGIELVMLDSQLHAKGFYENLGYEQRGDIFEEAGIPHVVMIKRFT